MKKDDLLFLIGGIIIGVLIAIRVKTNNLQNQLLDIENNRIKVQDEFMKNMIKYMKEKDTTLWDDDGNNSIVPMRIGKFNASDSINGIDISYIIGHKNLKTHENLNYTFAIGYDNAYSSTSERSDSGKLDTGKGNNKRSSN